MNIYVINMERSKDRWISISKQLDEIGVPYTRFEAIEGSKISNLSELFDIKRFEHESYHKLSIGEAGCALSHIGIWQKIIDDNEAGALVIEDDAILTDSFLALYNSLKNNTNDYDYLNLSPSPEDKHIKLSDLKNNRTILECFSKDGVSFVECEPVPYYMMTYYISNNGARVFLGSTNKMYYAVDMLPRYTSPYTKQGFTFPRASISADFNSEINDLSPRSYKSDRTGFWPIYYKLINTRKFLRKLFVQLEVIKLKYKLFNNGTDQK